MSIAFVLINTDMGSEQAVITELKKVDEVSEVYGVYGVYDLVLRLEASSLDEIKNAISQHIRTINGVKSTLTMIVM